MTPELTVLTLAALLQVVQFLMVAVRVTLEAGVANTFSPRDPGSQSGDIQGQLSLRSGRLFRAADNHFEALIFFTIAVLVITLAGKSTPFTAMCAYIYLGARILYVPAYVLGLAPWRSLIWVVGFGATTLMLLAAIL